MTHLSDLPVGNSLIHLRFQHSNATIEKDVPESTLKTIEYFNKALLFSEFNPETKELTITDPVLFDNANVIFDYLLGNPPTGNLSSESFGDVSRSPMSSLYTMA